MKNKRFVCVSFLVCLVFGLTLSSCGNTENTPAPTSVSQNPTANPAATARPKKNKYRIGMAQTTASKTDPWRVVMNEQIAAAAAKYPQLEVVFSDAGTNNTKQVADVESFLQQGIDLLIISPNEAAPLTAIVTKVYEQGIPVILLDRKVLGDKYTMWIGASNTAIGKKAGEYTAQWCKTNKLEPCNVVELRGLEGSTPAQERGNGFKQGVLLNSAVKIVESQNANWLYEKAIPVSQALYQKHPAVNVVYTHNDPMTEGSIAAAKSANLDTSKLLFIGIDALPTPDGGIKSVLDGRMSVTYVYPTGGAEAIEWAVKILELNQTPPKELILGTEEVTKANAAELYKKYGGK